jgi:hypothetical protein
MRGGAPASRGETVGNLIIPNKSKYCTPYKKGDKHRFSFKFPEPLNISAYGFRMANDAPDRDPRKWNLRANFKKNEDQVDPKDKFVGTFYKSSAF